MNLIGRMFLLTIRANIAVPHEDFKEAWLLNGLNARHVPKPRSVEDAFRRATPKKQWKNGLALLDYKGGRHVNDKSSNEVVMIYSKDSKSKVDIHHLNRCVIYLSGDQIEVEPFTPLTDEEFNYIEKIKKDFVLAKDYYDGSHARGAIQKVLDECSSLTYRDGNYLVPRTHFAQADGIVGMIHFLNQYTEGPKNILWDIPYIDTENTRGQVLESVVQHIESTVEMVLKEAANLKPSEYNIVKSRRSTLLTTLENTQLTIATYEKIMGYPLPDARALLQNAIVKFNAL